jgi:cobalt-zinc-cadmium efflux system protein
MASGGHVHSHGAPGHSHGGHGQGGAAVERSYGMAFAIGTALNLGFVVVEAAFGVLSNSVALLADAGHNLSDVLGLVVAWGASVLARRRPTERFTYGYLGSTILAALANAVFLLVATGAIAWEAIERFGAPEPVAAPTVVVVATIGIAINGITAWLFASGRAGDINIRGAFLHMLADAVVSAGVVVAGIGMLLTGWLWLDPVVSLLVAAVIVWGTWGLLRDSLRMSMKAVPPSIDPSAVRAYLREQAGVARLHDLHIWPLSTTETALTCHLVMPGAYPPDEFVIRVTRELRERFGIGHVTIQVETSEAIACALEPDSVV